MDNSARRQALAAFSEHRAGAVWTRRLGWVWRDQARNDDEAAREALHALQDTQAATDPAREECGRNCGGTFTPAACTLRPGHRGGCCDAPLGECPRCGAFQVRDGGELACVTGAHR